MHEVFNVLNERQYAVGLLLDMTKAYDRVQYTILLNKLYDIGIRGLAHKWLSSYLKNREQFVEIEHTDPSTSLIKRIRSDGININASIPQGSVIGCLLFLIYINDLPKIMKEPCVLFADDISLLTSCQDNTIINFKLTNILNKVKDWMDDHNLQINYEKSKLITFHPYQKDPLEICFTFNGVKLKVVNEFPLLGITIDTNINWKPHIQKIRQKLSRFSYALQEIKKTTDLNTALVTYYAYAYAWLMYGIILWGNSTDAPDLFTLQKKLVRIMMNIKVTDSCKPYFQKLELLTLPCIYILEICKFVRNYPEYYAKRDNLNRKYEQRRNKNNLILPLSRMKLYSSSVYISSVKVYNKLPETLKSNNNTKNFIYKLKKLLLQKSYYSINEYLDDDEL